ncbi:MAG: SANT/Myb-like DNA-binding domain-containing protein [Candidatus Bathyarchaeia archaeon]
MPRAKEWTNAEIERLKRLYPSNMVFEEIVDMFPERTANAIRLKASRMGLRRPLTASNIYPAKSLMVVEEGKNGPKGYIFRCSECNNWIQVDPGSVENKHPVICEKCGAICYFG